MSLLRVLRRPESNGAFFGRVCLDGEFICYSLERAAVAIPVGSYQAILDYSPKFQRLTPHLDVPGRTYIEIHPANWASQLEGCIAVGESIDGDALDDSKAAFETLMKRLPDAFTVEIVSA